MKGIAPNPVAIAVIMAATNTWITRASPDDISLTTQTEAINTRSMIPAAQSKSPMSCFLDFKSDAKV